ncbi:MAG: COX15/CtaA family protein [Crocinitomicaceae bacterium]|nr:COX15/CtaA family protein [Crocinitomicaceae bacterium]
MTFSKWFVRFNWIAVVLIYMIFIAGSLVRITGSGMGCPDWPKCFGSWIPPTAESQLPENYKEIFAEKRAQKIEKFAKLLTALGMKHTADQLLNDPELRHEESFNVKKTWTEYLNRLTGFLAGNVMLFIFGWIVLKYRKRKLVLLTLLNLALMGFQGWFGSIVVASNLVPWTITVHMFFGLLIVAIQLYVIRMVSPSQQKNLPQIGWMRVLIWLVAAITFYQMFLGTQVREAIDELVKLGYTREMWIDELGMPFFVHRSFSWLVLFVLLIVAWKNETTYKYASIRWIIGLLALELISGILLAYVDMPGVVQTSHLIFASAIFGIITMLIFRSKSVRAITP